MHKSWDSTHPCSEQSECKMKKKKVPERYKVVAWLEAPGASVEGTGRYRVVAWLMKPGATWLVVALFLDKRHFCCVARKARGSVNCCIAEGQEARRLLSC